MSSSHNLQAGNLNRCLVVIPAWNEEGSISFVIGSILDACGIDVLVVNDGSGDRTGELARKAGARVLTLPMNMGAWNATQAGFRYALAHGYKTVVTMDGDGQHFAQSLTVLLRELHGGNHDVVIGANPERATRCRRLSWSFFRMLTSIELEDFTSGLKAYNERAMGLLLLPRAHLFDYQDLGALLLIRRFGLRIKEVAVPMQKRLHGHSRVFSSWWKVSRYMLLSTALCLCKYRHLHSESKTCELRENAGI